MTLEADTLRVTLNSERRYGAEYKDGLSSHLPMVRIALFYLGASEAQQETFARWYRPRLEFVNARDERHCITPNTWKEHLGEHRYNAEYRDFFTAQIEEHGSLATLESVVPQLMEGVGAGAFHPLIRLAYALEIADEGEVAEALAAWCMAFLPLGSAPPLETTSFTNTLAASLQALTQTADIQGATIFERMERVSQQASFAHFGSLPTEASIAEFREPILDIYEGSDGDFTALHLVTSLHALRVVNATTALPHDALEQYWRAVGAAYLVIGKPEPSCASGATTTTPAWDAIAAVAVASKDDHLIKFVYTCKQEQAAYGDDRYRRLAARRAKLDS